jgi:serine/threonine-protein kinase
MKEIGPYQVISELGRGGMAIVYRALQPSLNRIVALKVLPSHMERDQEAVRRFRREAEVAGGLAHEAIVKVWDASVEQPPYYIAMEFLDGGTLAGRLAGRPLAPKEAIAAILPVCQGLEHAHQRGIVHRDVKPANIMFDKAGRPLVTDFGIARAIDRTQLTAPGARFGTPNYMSPEQASGLPTDRRTDIYSVGAVLYEMLTGRPPFGSDEPLSVMYRIAHEEPVKPSAFNPAVDPHLEAVVLRSLDKDPRRRFQTCAEMAAALSAAATAGASRPRRPAPTLLAVPRPGPPTPPTVRPPQVRRALLPALLVLVIVAAAAAGAVYFSSLAVPSARQQRAPHGGTAVARVAAEQFPPAPSQPVSSEQGEPSAAEAPEAQPVPQKPPAQPPPATAPRRVAVPNVVSMNLPQAQSALGQAGFESVATRQHDSQAPADQVLGQRPEAGSERLVGTRVELVVSDGPAPQTRIAPISKPAVQKTQLSGKTRAVRQPPRGRTPRKPQPRSPQPQAGVHSTGPAPPPP